MTRTRLRRLLLPQQRGGRGRSACATAGAARVAVVDIDAHHGNGTQAIFWERDDVLTGSVHVDPAPAGSRTSSASRPSAAAARDGANRNLPLPPGAGDDEWLAAVARARAGGATSGAEALVVALGVDAAGGDPESPLEVTRATASARPGARSARSGLPTVVVQEGGYDLATIGGLVLATLEGLEEGACGMPEPLDRVGRQGRVEGVPAQPREGPEAAAALAARGDRRDASGRAR